MQISSPSNGDALCGEHTSENTRKVNTELMLQSCVKLQADQR